MRPLLKFLRGAIVLWVGVIFVVAGIGATASGVYEWRKARRFEREAVSVHATVTAKSFESASRDGNTSTRYLVTYRFIGDDGAPHEQVEEISVDDWESLEEGADLAVRYLPPDFGSARSRALDPAWLRALLAIFPMLFIAIGAGLAWPQLRRAGVIHRVTESGTEAEGTVIEVRPTGTRINRVYQWQIAYEFRDGSGRACRGVTDLLPPQEAQSWNIGDRGIVRYDRQRPVDSLWLGKV